MDKKVYGGGIIRPDYKRIYSDLIKLEHPEKKVECEKILSKKVLSNLDVISINIIIFGNNDKNLTFNQRYRSYDTETILQILDYQKKDKLTNYEVAAYFKISRNTISKWKKKFLADKRL